MIYLNKGRYFRKGEMLLAIALFISSIAFFGLQTYSKQLPIRVEALSSDSCTPSHLPIGEAPGEPLPIWCYGTLNKGIKTAVYGTNSFVDTFEHPMQFADIDNDYTTFNISSASGRAVYWLQDNHWIIDSVDTSTMMRPDSTFTFENGKFIVEVDLSINAISDTNQISPGIILTTLPSPVSGYVHIPDILEQFSGNWRLGCTLQPAERTMSCHTRDATNKELISNAIYRAWTSCGSTNSDKLCFDRFRWEITKNAITAYVNGKQYRTFTLATPLSDDIIKNNYYMYITLQNNNKPGRISRFHAGRIAINPITAKITPSVTPLPKKPSLKPSPSEAIPKVSTNEASLKFNGKSFARIPHASYYNAPKGWTIETWFKDESGYAASTRYILTKGDTETTENIPYILGIENDSLFVGTRTGGRNQILTYSLKEQRIPDNQWHHMAATFNPKTGDLILYLDGIAVVKADIPSYYVKDNLKPLYIGKDGKDHFWIGKINDLRIWDTPRSAEEIRNNYQKELPQPSDNLIGNWKFDEGKGDTAYDFSAKREHMKIVQGLWSTDVHEAY